MTTYTTYLGKSIKYSQNAEAHVMSYNPRTGFLLSSIQLKTNIA